MYIVFLKSCTWLQVHVSYWRVPCISPWHKTTHQQVSGSEYGFSSVSWLSWLEFLDHTNMLTSSLCWINIRLSLLDLAWAIWLDLVCSSDVFTSSCAYIHISRRICDGEAASGTPSPGVIGKALRENRLVIFCLFAFRGLCSLRLRRHGFFISCHVLLPRCFSLSGTHLGSSFWGGGRA